MNRPHTAEVLEFGAVLPYTFSDVVANGSHLIHVEVTRMAGERHDPGDPGDVTVITPNGYGEDASVWRSFGRKLVHEAYAGGLAMTAVSYDDPTYFKQAYFTETVDVLARHYRQVGNDDHEVWLAPHSRGGKSVADCGEGLAKAGIIQGIRTMASPAGQMSVGPEHLTGWLNEVLRLPGALNDRETMAIYFALARNVTKRSLLHSYGTLQEVQEIVSDASMVAGRMRAISDIAGISVTAELRIGDGIVPGRRHAKLLGAVGLGRDVVTLAPGNHASPLVDAASRAALLECIWGRELAQTG